jgi:D-psicose/D-tagatose/L-ribulose 3-epimerase
MDHIAHLPNSWKYRFGAHQFIWKERWTNEDLGILDRAEALGLRLFEVSMGDEVVFNYNRLRRYAERAGIELTIGPGNLWPMDCDISHDDPAIRTKGIAWHKQMLRRAAECGAKAYCGAIYSHPGRVCRRQPPEDELSRAAENLWLLADYAEKLEVRLVIEPMSRFRNHLINTSKQAVQLAEMAGHHNVMINLDTFHMITEERDYGAAITCTSSRLWGIHACENDRGAPGGGLVPWPTVFESLQKVAGPVRVMLETYRTGPEGFGFERGIFQDLCPKPEEFVEKGIGYLKSVVDQIRNV